ncbi:MAG TPA: PDZ domain-containing protein [Dermatophilaceae bacterium]|nr:PDZ domain-containing protein [Dermatophilaceae bacterium]
MTTRVRWWLTGMLVVLLVLLVGDRINPPYVVFRPGAAINILEPTPGGAPLIRVSGAPTYPTSGALRFTTVSIAGGPGYDISLWDFLAARVDTDAEIRPRDEVFPPGADRDQVAAVSKAQMTGSQQEAVAVALRATGRAVSEQVVIREVVASTPASGRLRTGDVIQQVAGSSVRWPSDVVRLIQTVPAGQPVPVRVSRAGSVVSVAVPTVAAGNRRVLGVGLESRFRFPVSVTIDAGQVGGPSAGMMFALGVYDLLTPGALTQGRSVAGTGTIDSSGDVGRIDSIAYKMVGAHAAGADWFLAPAGNCRDVVGRAPAGLRVVRVGTFAEARDAVAAIGAGRTDGLATC